MSDVITLAKCQLELEKDFQILLKVVEEQGKKIEILEKKMEMMKK